MSLFDAGFDSKTRVTIPKTKSDDCFYRYTRPIVKTQTIKGKTCILNLDKISKDLGRTQSDIISYIKKGTGLGIDQKEFKLGNILMTGTCSVEKIEEIIEKFVKDKVLCPKCKSPEWTGKKCPACGCSKK